MEHQRGNLNGYGLAAGKGVNFNCREMQLGVQEGFDMNLNRVRRDTWSLDVLHWWSVVRATYEAVCLFVLDL